MEFKFQVTLFKEPEGGYTVIVPALPGCITYGESMEESMIMVKEAITLYLEEQINPKAAAGR